MNSNTSADNLYTSPTQTGIALVTGAGRRIGKAISSGLARAGWDIAIHYHHSQAEAEKVADNIRQLGRRAITLQADLSDETQVSQLIPKCIEQLGVPLCLVNNASLFQYDLATTFNYTALDTHMHINTSAPILLTRELYQRLPEDRQGIVINLLDQKLDNLNPDFFSYTVSKAALQTATIMMAQALAPKLRIVGIAPGITLASATQSQEAFLKAHKMAPLGYSSSPEDIAQAVCYLTVAKAVTGTILFVDGGQHLLPAHRDVMFFTE